jgi:glycerol-3-phosphate acyltransferase PlsY
MTIPVPTSLATAYVIGAIPTANVLARVTAKKDLRTIGNGTVSATGVYRVAGLAAFAVAGFLDLSKGLLAAVFAGALPGVVAAFAAGLVVTGHNWSVFLKGAGGRGILPAIGALALLAPAGAVVLATGAGIGRLLRETGLGCFVAQVLLLPLLGFTDGVRGLVLACAVVASMLLKRVLGNGRPVQRSARAYLTRLLYDRDSGPGNGSVPDAMSANGEG